MCYDKVQVLLTGWEKSKPYFSFMEVKKMLDMPCFVEKYNERDVRDFGVIVLVDDLSAFKC